MILEYAYKKNGDLYKQLLDSIPKGKYFDSRGEIIPFQDTSVFRVHTEHPNEIHYISIACENGQNINTTTIPSNADFVLEFKLPQGLNTITVLYDNKDYESKSYSCTHFGTILYAYAQNIKGAITRMDRLNRDIYKQESTRLSAPVQQYSKELSEKKAQRIFGLQLVTRALINSPGTFESLEDICKAIYVSTPVIEDVESKDIFDLSHYSFAGQEYELGKIIYLWVRSPALVRRLYGLLLCNASNIPVESTDTTLESEDGLNEYRDSENPLIVDENGFSEYDEESGDGYIEISAKLDLEVPRLDRNLPIPFTTKHPWHDRDKFELPETLDVDRPLDIATWFDPLNDGLIGKQEIPYRYDGSKVTSLIKVIKFSHITNGVCGIDFTFPVSQNYVSIPEVEDTNATGAEVPQDNVENSLSVNQGSILREHFDEVSNTTNVKNGNIVPTYYEEATQGLNILGGVLEV